jgi:hypothetical protein
MQPIDELTQAPVALPKWVLSSWPWHAWEHALIFWQKGPVLSVLGMQHRPSLVQIMKHLFSSQQSLKSENAIATATK